MNKPPYPYAWYFDKSIISTYESWYEGKGRRADLLEKELLLSLLADFGKIESLLEVGAGTGHFTRWFASMGLNSVGLDISQLMLYEAKKFWDGFYVIGDSSKLPFNDKSFDVVAFITCMEYMSHPIEVLKEGGRVARKGIIWGIMNRWSLPTIRRSLQVLLGRNPFYRNAHFFSILEAKRLLNDALIGHGLELRWKTTVFPRMLGSKSSSLPFGAFLGISARLLHQD